MLYFKMKYFGHYKAKIAVAQDSDTNPFRCLSYN